MSMKEATLEKLSSFLKDGEAIGSFTVPEMYQEGYFIIPNDKEIGQIDVSACIEETLHRLLDADNAEENDEMDGNDKEDADSLIREILIADTDEQENELSLEIDLNYRIHGSVCSFKREPYTALSFETKLYERYKLLWMMDQGITLGDAFAEFRDYCNPENGADPSDSSESLFESWEDESGFSGSEYVCFHEWLGADYRFGDERLFQSDKEKNIWLLDQTK